MTHAFDANQPTAPDVAINVVKVRDEISRLSQRLARARASYAEDLARGDADVPFDAQLATIETYTTKLEALTEQLRLHESGPASRTAAAAAVPAPPAAPLPHRMPQGQWAPLPVPQATTPPATVFAPVPSTFSAPTGTAAGIAPDGGLILSDGTVIRTEEAALGEYVRLAAELRWVAAHHPSQVAQYARVPEEILTFLAHRHGVTTEEERQALTRQVDARFRRDYG